VIPILKSADYLLRESSRGVDVIESGMFATPHGETVQLAPGYYAFQVDHAVESDQLTSL
jgi:hypothetical protein